MCNVVTVNLNALYSTLMTAAMLAGTAFQMVISLYGVYTTFCKHISSPAQHRIESDATEPPCIRGT